MTIKAIPLPELSSYAGSELLMDSPGFTLDGQGLLVRVSYLAASSLRHAAWLYDLKQEKYTLNINASLGLALGQQVDDLSLVDIHAVQALALQEKPGLAVLYSLPGQDDDKHLALLIDGKVTSLNVLGDLPSGKVARFAMSSDGRFVALQTDAAVMEQVTDANQGDDVYLLDRQTGQFTRVSTAAGDDPTLPSQLGSLLLHNGQVQISFISEYAFSTKDTNGESAQAGDAYLWSQNYGASGLSGQPTLTLLSSNGTLATGGMTVSGDGQPEFAGPLITANGVYFNSISPQLAVSDTNSAADVFVYANNQTSRLTWNQQTVLDAGAAVVSTSRGGEIVALLSSSSAVAGDYGSTVLMVVDARSGSTTVLPANLAASDGAVVSAALSPNGALAAFTSNATTPLAGSSTLIEGTLYLAQTGRVSDRSATGSVALAGTVAQGQRITASVTALSDEDGAITATSYQWQRSADGNNWLDIEGANASAYTIASAQSEVGAYLRLRLITSDALGGSTAFFSTAQRVANTNDAPTGGVTIGGAARQGQVLTASHTLADADGIPSSGTGAIKYQWLAGGVAINNATASTYAPTQADVGKTITVTASYIDQQGSSERMTSSATAAVLNVNDAPNGSVTISGTATQGQVLRASNTLADADGISNAGTGVIKYQWKAGGTSINGATTNAYTLTQAEVGKAITVTASYVDSFGQAESVSSSPSSLVLSLGFAAFPAKFWKDNSKAPSEVKKAEAINLSDAIGILKMIVGLNVNSGGAPLTPYQAVAADFDQSGSVDLTDAIGVLKMVVGLAAPVPVWRYFDDAKLASAYIPAQSLNHKAWSASGLMDVSLQPNANVKLVGVLTGDVDGSWTA
jgi:hypothetical protein